jgi:hypothetical protein
LSLLFGGNENPLRKVIEVVASSLAVVTVIVHVPDVGDVLLFQMRVDAFGNADETVLVAAGTIEQFQRLAQGSGS